MLFDLLTEEDKTKMNKMIHEFVDSNSGFSPLSQIMRTWNDRKEGMYKLLGGESLIIKKDLQYSRDTSEMENEIRQKVVNKNFKFMRDYYKFVEKLYEERVINLEKKCHLTDFFSLYSLRTNNVNLFEDLTIDYNEKTMTIKVDAKLSKLFGKLNSLFGFSTKEDYEEFRNAHAAVLNDSTLNGTLCLSIHPLDFMTMSMNNCSWRSCMDWDAGEYRLGTVEMMDSKCVVVAYIVNDKDPEFEPCNEVYWNNKKWRELFIVDKDIIAGVKGYPNINRDIEKSVIIWLKELAEKNLGYNNYKDDCEYIRCEKTMENGYQVSLTTHAMYNDCYGEIQCFLTKEDKDIRVDYGQYPNCMACGSTGTVWDECDTLTLSCCHEEEYDNECCECGERLYSDDTYWVNDECYCEDCYNDLPSCECCGEAMIDDNVRRIHFAFDDTDIDADFEVILCSGCLTYNSRWGRIDTKLINTPEEVDYRNSRIRIASYKDNLEDKNNYLEVFDRYYNGRKYDEDYFAEKAERENLEPALS